MSPLVPIRAIHRPIGTAGVGSVGTLVVTVYRVETLSVTVSAKVVTPTPTATPSLPSLTIIRP